MAPPPHRGLARTLVVLASVLAFLALPAIWLNRQLLSTDNWTAASSRLLDDPAIRDQTAAYLTDQLYANVDVDAQIQSALPTRAQFLADPLAGALRERVDAVAEVALSRPKVQGLWEDANRAAHERFLRVLDGGGSVVSTNDGQVTIDLKTLLADVEERTGIGGRVAGALPADAAQLEVMQSDQLATAQDAARILGGLPIVLCGLSLLCFGGALLASPGRRRQTVRGYGIGLAAAGAGALAVGAWAGDAVVDSLATTAAVEPAIRGVWDVYDTLLQQASTAAIFYGAILVGGAWVAGPSRWAVTVRRTLAPYLREPAVAYAALGVVLIGVIAWWAPTPAMRNPVTAVLLAALLALGFEGLRRRTVREFPAVLLTQATLPNGAATVETAGRPAAEKEPLS